MNKTSYCALWLGALVASSATLAAHAHAQSCGGTECGAGFECKTESYQSCSGGGMGGFGEPPLGGIGGFAGMVAGTSGAGTGGAGTTGGATEVVCETVEYKYCTNATCETNADCPETMGCLAQTTTECTVSGSAGTGAGGTAGMAVGGAGGDCSDDGGCSSFECHQVPTDSICVPRYQIPCEIASDCGGGFDCVESFGWFCGGGGAGGAPAVEDGGVMQPDDGAMTPDGGGAGFGGDYTCEQISNGFNQCELQVLPCGSNADCPAGLECSSYYEYPECTYDGDGDSDGAGGRGEAGSVAGGAGGTSGASGSAGTGETGGMGGVSDGGGVYSCPEPIITQRCQLPGYEGGGMGGTGGTTDPGGDSDAGSDNGSAGMGGGAGGVGGGAGTSAAGMSGSAGEGAPDDDGSADEDHGHHGHHGHGRGLLRRLLGCSTSGPISGGSSTGGWVMLGLSALVLRRRVRRG